MHQTVFGIFYIFIVALVLAVCALVVAGRILGMLAGGIGRMLGLIPPRPRMMMAAPMRRAMAPLPPIRPIAVPPGYIQCRVPGCRHANPINARFCRHCGHAFPVPYGRAPKRTENYM